MGQKDWILFSESIIRFVSFLVDSDSSRTAGRFVIGNVSMPHGTYWIHYSFIWVLFSWKLFQKNKDWKLKTLNTFLKCRTIFMNIDTAWVLSVHAWFQLNRSLDFIKLRSYITGVITMFHLILSGIAFAIVAGVAIVIGALILTVGLVIFKRCVSRFSPLNYWRAHPWGLTLQAPFFLRFHINLLKTIDCWV